MTVEDLSLPDSRESDEQNRAVVEVVIKGLSSNNLAMRPDPSAAPITLGIGNDEGYVCAGLLGRTAWGWLWIDSIWVSDEHRDYGFGRELIERAEQIAK